MEGPRGEEDGSGLELGRAFDGRTVYLNRLEGVSASEVRVRVRVRARARVRVGVRVRVRVRVRVT